MKGTKPLFRHGVCRICGRRRTIHATTRTCVDPIVTASGRKRLLPNSYCDRVSANPSPARRLVVERTVRALELT